MARIVYFRRDLRGFELDLETIETRARWNQTMPVEAIEVLIAEVKRLQAEIERLETEIWRLEDGEGAWWLAGKEDP